MKITMFLHYTKKHLKSSPIIENAIDDELNKHKLNVYWSSESLVTQLQDRHTIITNRF
jgi:hypothetical protein